jgi:hypothetical protein
VLLRNGFLRLGYLSTILKCIKTKFKNGNGQQWGEKESPQAGEEESHEYGVV